MLLCLCLCQACKPAQKTGVRHFQLKTNLKIHKQIRKLSSRGKYFPEMQMSVCKVLLETLTIFQNQNHVRFSYPIYGLIKKITTLCQNKLNPGTAFKMNNDNQLIKIVNFKSHLTDQSTQTIPYFRAKGFKNHTIGTIHTYIAHIRESPTPPSPK